MYQQFHHCTVLSEGDCILTGPDISRQRWTVARREDRVESSMPGSTVTVFWQVSRPSNLSMHCRLTVTCDVRWIVA